MQVVNINIIVIQLIKINLPMKEKVIRNHLYREKMSLAENIFPVGLMKDVPEDLYRNRVGMNVLRALTVKSGC